MSLRGVLTARQRRKERPRKGQVQASDKEGGSWGTLERSETLALYRIYRYYIRIVLGLGSTHGREGAPVFRLPLVLGANGEQRRDERGIMAEQADAAALAELGRQLYRASLRGEAAKAARLLDLNAPINHRKGGHQFMPLLIAALRGHIEVVTLLANRGSDLEARTTDGHSALLSASCKGHLAVVQLLVERKF